MLETIWGNRGMVRSQNYQTPETLVNRYTFTGGISTRGTSTTKDQRYVNLYQEVIDKENLAMIKRPGLVQHAVITPGVGRGIFVFASKVYTCIGNTLYKDGVSFLTLTTSTGSIGFTECTNQGAPAIFFCDGAEAWLISFAGVATKILNTYTAWTATTVHALGVFRRPTVENSLYYEVTTAGTTNATQPTWPTTIGDTVTDGTIVWTCRAHYGGLPAAHIPTPVFINGYIAIPRAASADIYTCNADLPISWNPSDFITSEMFPDDIKALARQNNQVVAFGEYGTEFFYDNGANQLTGSPLARNANTFLQIGTPAPFCLGQSEQNCYFIGVSQTGGRAVWKLDGFNASKISTPSIERVIGEESGNIVSATGYLVRLAGHFFFVICLQSRTLIYDTELNLWHEWSSAKQATFTPGAINGSAVDINAINSGKPADIHSTTEFKWVYGTDTNTGEFYVLHKSTGQIAKFDLDAYVDVDQVIRCEVYTPILDFGDYNRKFLHRITVVGDLATDIIFVRWSDDDYRTWSNLKYLSMSKRPVLHRLGSFRRRAFNIYYTDKAPLRLNGIEFQYTKSEV